MASVNKVILVGNLGKYHDRAVKFVEFRCAA